MPHLGIDAMGDFAHNIPTDTPAVFGYVTGSGGVKWTAEQFARFHNSGIGYINQDNDPNPHIGDIFDIEQGAGDLTRWWQWAEGRRRLGRRPIAYGSRTTHEDVRAQSAEHPHVGPAFMLADPGIGRVEAERLLTGDVIGVQFAWPTTDPHMLVPGSHLTLAQANCDVWVLDDTWFHRHTPMPAPHGIANAAVSIDLATGHPHVHPTPGHIRLSRHGDIMRYDLTVDSRTGHWTIAKQ